MKIGDFIIDIAAKLDNESLQNAIAKFQAFGDVLKNSGSIFKELLTGSADDIDDTVGAYTDLVKEALGITKKEVKNTSENAISAVNSFASAAKTALSAIGIVASLKEMNRQIEQFEMLARSINTALGGVEDIEEVEENILKYAEEAKVSYSLMATSATSLTRANESLFPLDEALEFTETVSKLMKTAGSSESEIQSVMTSMKESAMTGKLSSGVVSSLINNAPEAAQALADTLGVPIKRLQGMASAGLIKTETFKKVIMSQASAIDEKFSQVGYTISDAITVVKDKWALWLKETDDELEITKSIADYIIKLSDVVIDFLDKVKEGLKFISEKVGGGKNLMLLLTALFAVFNFSKIITGIKTVLGLLGLLKTAISPISIIVVALFLIVQDIVYFMQGKNSLIGKLATKWGWDLDELRQKFVNIKDYVVAFAKGIIDSFSWVVPAFKGIIKIIEFVVGIIARVVNAIGGAGEKGEETARVIGKIVGVIVQIITVLGALPAIVGAVLSFIAKICGGVGKVISIVKTVGSVVGKVISFIAPLLKALGAAIMAHPVVAIIVAVVAALGVLFVWMKKTGKWEGFVEGCKKAWNSVKAFIKDFMSAIINSFNKFGYAILDIMLYPAREAIKAGKNILDTIVGMLSGDIGITEGLSEIFQSISDICSAGARGLANAIWTLLNGILGGLPQKALEWGKDVINNMVEGLKDKVANSALGQAASGAAEVIKDILGFSEPKKGPLSNFHTYMPDMMSLMSKGIKENVGTVLTELNSLTSDMSNILSMGSASGSTVANATSSSNVSKTVVQNVNINNEFNGDKAIQQNAASAMDSSAKNVNDELIHGLMYAY